MFHQFYSAKNRIELIKFINVILTECRADWMQNYVVYPLPLVEELQVLIENYRLILISIEASSYVRFLRAQEKYEIKELTSFIDIDHSFQLLFHGCHQYKHAFTISNCHSTHSEFWEDLKKFNFGDNELLRPKWDTYFMRIAHITSTRTNCMKRAVGAVIV